MKKIALLVAAALCLSGHAEPLTIKDFVMGEDLKVAAEKGGMSCRTLQDQPGEFCYNLSSNKPELIQTIATVPAKRVIISSLDDGKLGNVRYTFAQSDFSIVRSAFQDKYPGMKCSDSAVQNRMGATFDQTVCEFTSKTGTVTVSKRASDLTEGYVDVSSAEYLKGLGVWADERKKRGKKDI